MPSSQHSKDMFSVEFSASRYRGPSPVRTVRRGSQASKTLNSLVFSAIELLASEEVTSQVITYQEEVVKQSQASQQEVGEDLAGWDMFLSCRRGFG